MNSFSARTTLEVSGRQYEIYRLGALSGSFEIERLPFSIKILLENLLRREDGTVVTREDIEAVASWDPKATPSREIAYRPARVILQDFTGVPAVVDFAAMREAMKEMGGDPSRINPLQPAELVIDHSVQVDAHGTADSFQRNTDIEFERNRERYQFLKWGQQSLANFRVVPPGTGIVHQVNLEHLARGVFVDEQGDKAVAYPDTLVGTDSHTTMINGLGVLGWGVGGIEAEAAMLGQPISMLIPQVIGFELKGSLAEGATATDLVLTVVEMLRQKGVVGKFVEFFGSGLAELPLADRATIANMAPEYGATCGLFPIDAETIRYMELTARSKESIELMEAYAKEQGFWPQGDGSGVVYTDTLSLDMKDVVPCIAGPKRPQDRITLTDAKRTIDREMRSLITSRRGEGATPTHEAIDGSGNTLSDGSVVIAAITSCTNTSNPAVMLGAGLLARKAIEKGLQTKPWVKTSLAPGSKVVTEYLDKAGLSEPLNELGFDLVGYGCTTCIGNSGPLPSEIGQAIKKGDLVVSSVLSGNRNFEGRVHADVRMNFLASPPLVVAYALAGRSDIDITNEPLGQGKNGEDVYLKDIWPSLSEVHDAISSVEASMFSNSYSDVFRGSDAWAALDVPDSELYAWNEESTYVKSPPFFEGMKPEPDPIRDIRSARVLCLLGDSVTTDHISPAGAFKEDTPAGRYLVDKGVAPSDFNSYGSRRGNHEVMMRGTFANVRLRNQLAPGTEGSWTRHLPDGEKMSIYDAAMKYKSEGVPLIVLAGKEYGSGSSRDWAAKGPALLGIKAVITESYERIHRSNLVGLGILPLCFKPGESVASHGLTGEESFDFEGIGDGSAKELTVNATAPDGSTKSFKVDVRLDTPQEVHYYHHGGILQYVLRQMRTS